MLSLVLTRIGNFSSKMKTKQVLSSSYDDLVNLVAKKYGNNQFRHPNTAALYQIQHHFKIISAGDCILDLGAAPHFRWTELALNLAENEQNTHRVISNDKIECRRPKANHIHIQGNFVEEQIKTKIALALEERKFNAILCDMSPEFTGELEDDAESLASMIQQAFLFGNVFLHKGGHLVCKVLQSAHSDLLQESGKLLFHQTYSYKPSVIRERSPVKFLIFKGYSINHNLEALREFYSRYRGSPKNKVELVNAYKGKYNWDPVDMVRRRAKNDILELKMMGRTQRQIENMFKNDPFINIAEIIKQLRLLDKANKEGDQVKLQKAINAFSDGKLYKEAMEIPVTREEWITYIETMEAKLKEAKLKQKKKGNQKPKQSFQPLGDNQVYMRKENVQAQEKQQIVYIKEDLSGDYDLEYERDYIQRQIQKFGHLFRKTKGRLGQGQQYQLGKNVELTQVFKQREEKQEKLRPLSEMAEDLRLMTDEQFKKMTDQQGYDRQIEENVSRPPKGMRNKFKNR